MRNWHGVGVGFLFQVMFVQFTMKESARFASPPVSVLGSEARSIDNAKASAVAVLCGDSGVTREGDPEALGQSCDSGLLRCTLLGGGVALSPSFFPLTWQGQTLLVAPFSPRPVELENKPASGRGSPRWPGVRCSEAGSGFRKVLLDVCSALRCFPSIFSRLL